MPIGIIYPRKNMREKSLSHVQDLLLAMIREIGTSSVYGKKLNKIGMSMEHVLALRDEYLRSEELKLFKRMQRTKLIRLESRQHHMLAILTNKGLIEVLKAMVLTETKVLPNNEHVAVIFDVPESMRPVRLALRTLLKSIGFKMVQKSVWIGQIDVVREFRALVRFMKAEKYISILHITHGRYD